MVAEVSRTCVLARDRNRVLKLIYEYLYVSVAFFGGVCIRFRNEYRFYFIFLFLPQIIITLRVTIIPHVYLVFIRISVARFRYVHSDFSRPRQIVIWAEIYYKIGRYIKQCAPTAAEKFFV